MLPTEQLKPKVLYFEVPTTFGLDPKTVYQTVTMILEKTEISFIRLEGAASNPALVFFEEKARNTLPAWSMDPDDEE